MILVGGQYKIKVKNRKIFIHNGHLSVSRIGYKHKFYFINENLFLIKNKKIKFLIYYKIKSYSLYLKVGGRIHTKFYLALWSI